MKTYTYLSIVLLTFDAYALWVGIHPHVPESYRKYFIEHSITQEEFLQLYHDKAS